MIREQHPAWGYVRNVADIPATPWRNQAGLTRELASFPAQSSLDDFIWRVSIAEINAPSAFSQFPGVDRSISLLGGSGFTIALEDGSPLQLDTPGAVHPFAGELAARVINFSGPSRDFNLMLRRDAVQGELLSHAGVDHLALTADSVLLYVAQGQVALAEARRDGVVLHEGDMAVLHAQRPALNVTTLSEHAHLLEVRVQSKQGKQVAP